MHSKIKVAGVSYLNTKPLLYGIEKAGFRGNIDLILEYPSAIAAHLRDGSIDLGLVPVAAIPGIPGARIISEYGIAADGKVASVCLFSRIPLEEIEAVYLDYQSRTSVALARILFRYYWKKTPEFIAAPEDYIERIQGAHAGVIIGDRALIHSRDFPFVYDLSEHWKYYTGLPFIFAAWVANKELPERFLQEFNEANATGLDHLEEIITANPFPAYDMGRYYRENIRFRLDAEKHKGLDLFLEYLRGEEKSAGAAESA